MENRDVLTVNQLFELLGEMIDSGKGDYKMKIDVNEYYVDLKEIRIIDNGKSICEDRTVNVL